MQCCAGRRAGVLDIDHRNTLESKRQQRHLTAHQMLALDITLRAIAVKRRAHIGGMAARIGERRHDRILRQLLDRQVRMACEWRHANADDVNFLHTTPLPGSVSCCGRQSIITP